MTKHTEHVGTPGCTCNRSNPIGKAVTGRRGDSSHLTRLSVESVDDHLLLCELSPRLVVSTCGVACPHVTEVCVDLESVPDCRSLRASFRELRYRHCYKSFITWATEGNQSADKCFARVLWVKHVLVYVSASKTDHINAELLCKLFARPIISLQTDDRQ